MDSNVQEILAWLPAWTAAISGLAGFLGVVAGSAGSYFIQTRTYKEDTRKEFRQLAINALLEAYGEASAYGRLSYNIVSCIDSGLDTGQVNFKQVVENDPTAGFSQKLDLHVLFYAPALSEPLLNLTNQFGNIRGSVSELVRQQNNGIPLQSTALRSLREQAELSADAAGDFCSKVAQEARTLYGFDN